MTAQGRPAVRLGPALRLGNGVALSDTPDTTSTTVPFTLPGELVELAPAAHGGEWTLLRVLEPSPERVAPGCPHFGRCGGCQLQMASAGEQLRLKHDGLADALTRAGVKFMPQIETHAAEPWGYRNRIRLRVGRDKAGSLRFGYNERNSRRFLPVHTCPISAPVLWHAAQTLLITAASSPEVDVWLSASAEVELFASDQLDRLQVLLLLDAPPPPNAERSFPQAMQAVHASLPALAGAGAARLGPQQRARERTRTPVAGWGAAGLAYDVPFDDPDGAGSPRAERYWVTRGSFFQVNRFLVPELVQLACRGRSGRLAWDLFAGVGLFARVLAQSFEQVTAVEGNPIAARDLNAALGKLSKAGREYRAVEASTLEFLQAAVVQRERPNLVTLDPPRAGAGEAVCELLLRLCAPEIVYVSCDPETLAHDLAVLQRGYRLSALHLVDMFPQTYHQEAVAVLTRR